MTGFANNGIWNVCGSCWVSVKLILKVSMNTMRVNMNAKWQRSRRRRGWKLWRILSGCRIFWTRSLRTQRSPGTRSLLQKAVRILKVWEEEVGNWLLLAIGLFLNIEEGSNCLASYILHDVLWAFKGHYMVSLYTYQVTTKSQRIHPIEILIIVIRHLKQPSGHPQLGLGCHIKLRLCHKG